MFFKCYFKIDYYQSKANKATDTLFYFFKDIKIEKTVFKLEILAFCISCNFC